MAAEHHPRAVLSPAAQPLCQILEGCKGCAIGQYICSSTSRGMELCICMASTSDVVLELAEQGTTRKGARTSCTSLCDIPLLESALQEGYVGFLGL